MKRHILRSGRLLISELPVESGHVTLPEYQGVHQSVKSTKPQCWKFVWGSHYLGIIDLINGHVIEHILHSPSNSGAGAGSKSQTCDQWLVFLVTRLQSEATYGSTMSHLTGINSDVNINNKAHEQHKHFNYSGNPRVVEV